MSIFTVNASAFTVSVQGNYIKRTVVQQKEYKKIALSEVSKEVMDKIKRDYGITPLKKFTGQKMGSISASFR